MDPPLRRRLSWRTTSRNGIVAPLTVGTMARTGATFATAGALFGLLSVITPHAASLDEGLLAATAGASLLLAVVLILGYERLPPWSFHAATAVGTGLTAVAVYAWGSDSYYAPLPFLWVTFFAFCFFSRGAAVAHLGLIGVAYALALVAIDPSFVPVSGWIGTVGTLLVIGLLVGRLRDRLVEVTGGLTDAARRDPLTDLLNRRGFDEVFDVELERARRGGATLSLIVADLDRFKRLNEEQGHAAGDEVLRDLARCVLAEKRSFDSAGRLGGQEFAILAPDCDEHGAYILAERVRTGVERSSAGEPVALTISLGIATFPLHGESADALMRAADQALYAAKRLGRNRSVISSAEVPGILARARGGHEEGQIELTALLDLAEALDVRDAGNAAHCQRVGRFAELMARELGLSPDSVERVRLAGILHDVGRVGMPDSLFEKQGPLTDEEWGWVRSHPEIGARMLETTDFDDIRTWVLAHHERPDGTGYPEGVSWDDVPLEARIIAVADAYEAMTAERPYREALGVERAAEELRRGAGRQFDSDVVEALLRVL